MSGIAGIVLNDTAGVSLDSLGRMAAVIRHRGPDGYGFYCGRKVGLAHVALNTIDSIGVGQPIANEDGQIILACGGEVFNHTELRRELEARGHLFRTRSHVEVILHGYEEWGPNLLQRLDGQFALALYDRNRETLLVARDRFGVRPLFYAQRDGDLYFGSEVKAILASGAVEPALDPRGLDEVLKFGAARPPRTPFSGIAALEPGTYGIWKDGAFWLRHYYELDYPEASAESVDVVEQLDEIMLRSVGMRLRSQLGVGTYLSGGLNSSITASLARSASVDRVQSFSITSATSEFDESYYQDEVARAVGSVHRTLAVPPDTIAHSFPAVLWHTETPLLETAPALMFHLAKLTRESGVTVAIGGEGGNELFLGNDLFKEVSVRRFCLRRPDSVVRRRLFDRVYSYPHADHHQIARQDLLDAAEPSDPLFSHLPLFLSSSIEDFYERDFKARIGGLDVICELRASLPTRFFGWSPLNKAAYLEMTTRLSPCVMSSYGDRMTTAHGLEGRYPFLDHRVFEFAAALPTGSRLRGLRDKEILRRWAARILPREIACARRSINRASEARLFFSADAPSWVHAQLSREALERVGIFSPAAVSGLVQRWHAGATATLGEQRAMIGVLSTQLWHSQFLDRTLFVQPLPVRDAAVLLGDVIAAEPSSGLYAPKPY